MTPRTPADNNAARAAIMARVSEALRVPAPRPHRGAGGAEPQLAGSMLPILSETARPWLPDGGESPAESLRILEENLEKLRARMFRVPDISAAADCLSTQARERDWRQVAWHAHPLVESLLAGVPCAAHQVDGGTAFDPVGLESCDAGLTACECLVAQTGSILVSSQTCGGRAISILPHAHVVVATLDQIVPTLADAFSLVRQRHAGSLPSMLSFITGPSRTGDIERILVLGAHGPKELILILVG
jgi:L-lactate dehydrogenase complex protein LldG